MAKSKYTAAGQLRQPNNDSSANTPKTTKPVENATCSTPAVSGIDQPLVNIMKLSHLQCQPLLQGRLVKILKGDEVIFKIPLRLLLAVSAKVQATIRENPETESICIAAGTAPAAAVHTLNWLLDTVKKNKGAPLPGMKDMDKTIRIFYAAAGLGIEETYYNKLFGRCFGYIKYNIPAYSVCTAIEQSAPNTDDALFKCLVNRLCWLRFNDKNPDKEGFEGYLAKHPKLNYAMKAVDKSHEDARTRAETLHTQHANRQHSQYIHDRRATIEAHKQEFFDRLYAKAQGSGLLNEREERYLGLK